ncbi:MAG: hypothetical protein QOD99_147 [Chthoniobacter sp.]|jgi:type II secretory pathway pseudopilin PulG|nr:hypothetical protein [Chthoniobacter sp.]
MKRASLEKGFSLVEITISLGIMAFCLIALFGLLPVGLTSNQTSVEQTKVASVAAGVVTDLRAKNPSVALQGKSPRYGFDLTKKDTNPQTLYVLEDGSVPPSGTVGGAFPKGTSLMDTPRYLVSVACTPPAATTPPKRIATSVRVLVTWPAAADQKPGTWPKNYTGFFETVVALDRN